MIELVATGKGYSTPSCTQISYKELYDMLTKVDTTDISVIGFKQVMTLIAWLPNISKLVIDDDFIEVFLKNLDETIVFENALILAETLATYADEMGESMVDILESYYNFDPQIDVDYTFGKKMSKKDLKTFIINLNMKNKELQMELLQSIPYISQIYLDTKYHDCFDIFYLDVESLPEDLEELKDFKDADFAKALHEWFCEENPDNPVIEMK